MKIKDNPDIFASFIHNDETNYLPMIKHWEHLWVSF